MISSNSSAEEIGGAVAETAPMPQQVAPDPPPRPTRRSKALAALCVELTDTKTLYPGTDVTVAYSLKDHSAVA